MIRIIHYRAKCIGCNACVEINNDRWRMSRKDGKSTLVGGEDKNGVYNVMVDDDEYESAIKAAKICPVRIIQAEKLKP